MLINSTMRPVILNNTFCQCLLKNFIGICSTPLARY
jgi:hypothetical protein